jgi:hypothetical protein
MTVAAYTNEVLPKDLEVRIEYTSSSHLAAMFSTHNGEAHHLPVNRCVVCPMCRSTLDEEVDAEAVIHVYGPEVVSPTRLASLHAECKDKGPVTSLLTFRQQPTSEQPSMQPSVSWEPSSQPLQVRTSGVEGYLLVRHGKGWSIPPAVVEEAAAKVPSLKKILWPEEVEPFDPDGKQNSQA